MKKINIRKYGILFGGILLFLVPLAITNPYFMYVLNLILIYIILALGLDLIVGYTGQVSVGHGAFFGVGAYLSAVLSTKLGYSFWLTLPLSIIFTAIVGLIIGYIGLKLVEEYLVMATLAFGTILWLIFLNWSDMTGGPMGISGIPSPPPIGFGTFKLTFEEYGNYYPLFLIFVLLAIFVSRLLMESGFGRACNAIRDDELAAQAMGIPVFKTKVMVFTISTAFCGAAGSLYAHFLHVVSPETFGFSMSVTILTMVMIGGQGTITGAIIGASLLTVFSEALRATPELRMVVYGFLIVIMIMFFPRGIMGLTHLFRKRLSRSGVQVNGAAKKEGLRYE
ncbi:MAG TPA: branched-chain amino acid ABC transporter permease [Bacillus bacterium]|uniref:branched-chain amino acid ABC transporter permease n=1 Tax=Siminovitchia fordii TaxID=254759 RepID=UPI0003A9DBAF|nr:branched-chain amino acid ABC transporter permease [Siminovitchia fordii]HBZ12019.1 branched-chain amino acid ABC transporter permease [Bacillus sp. (in: firmicutes)]